MSRRETTRRTFLGEAMSLGVASTLRGFASETKSVIPNIVYINTHDSGRYFQSYGHQIPTPNLQRLATEGILFRNAFSVAPTCSPSRSGLLTGQCPHKNGMFGLVNQGWTLNDYSKHIIHTLGAAGYTTAQAGVQHVAPDVRMIGYDVVIPTGNGSERARNHASARDAAPAATAFLNGHPKEPFFLEVGFFETHRPYTAPSFIDNSMYIAPPAPLPDVDVVRADMAAYHASARIADEGIGLILETLERQGYLDRTLVIFTTDHGISFPDMKCSLTDNGTAISLVMRGPKEFRGGAVCNALISQLDVFPTLCEYIGIQPPSWLEGKSFMPVLRGQAQEINDAVFSEVTYHAAYEPKRAVRTGRWKYIRRYDDRKTPVVANCDPSPSKSYWLDHGWQQLECEEKEKLFDLVFDPNERVNLVSSAGYIEVLRQMRGRLERWMQETEDPLLKGPIPLARGAKTISPNDIVRDWSGFKPAQI